MELMRCICGVDYVRGLADNEAWHRREHADFAKGPRVGLLTKVPQLGAIQGFPLRVIDSGTPRQVATKVARIAMVACREIGGPAGFYGDGRADQELFVLNDQARCIAMVFVGRTAYHWHLAWNEAMPSGLELTRPKATIEDGLVIARVWIAGDYRQRGVAQELTQFVIARLGMKPEATCWELPFTAGGRALARKFAPSTFLGSCDPLEMGEILRGRSKP